MPLESLESLVEERVSQLEVITKRRNELLREMYRMVRRRNVCTMLTGQEGGVVEGGEEDDPELRIFLERYDFQKNPETGSITTLSFNELFDTRVPICDDFAHDRISGPYTRERDHPPTPKSPSVAGSLSPPIRTTTRQSRRSKAAPLIDLTRTDNEDDHAQKVPSTYKTVGPLTHEDELESDDILDLVPQPSPMTLPPGRHSQAQSHAIPFPEDDDERDELDLIGSLSPSSHRSRTSMRSAQEPVPPSDSFGTQAVALTEVVQDEEEEKEAHEIVMQTRPADDSFELESEPSQLPGQADTDVLMSAPHERVGGVLYDESGDQEMMEVEAHHQRAVGGSLDESAQKYGLHSRLSCPPPVAESGFDAPKISDGTTGRGSQFTGPFVPIVTTNMAPRGRPVIIPAPASPIMACPSYSFDLGSVESKKPLDSAPSPKPRFHIHPFGNKLDYPLPPLKALPPEFSRNRRHRQKKREKEKEREKGSDKMDGKKESKEEWASMGLTKWGAMLRANPVHRRVSRAAKCLSTRDWNIAISELRLLRTIERIERLKDEGRWSFRQPKKQRGIGGLTKTHWDYLMDEMRWMRTDFREERKWKIAVAYTLSTAVLEWHHAGTLAERVRKGISVLWKRPRVQDDDVEMEDMPQENQQYPAHAEGNIQAGSKTSSLSLIEYPSDDDDDQLSVVDTLEPSILIQEALEDSRTTTAGDNGLCTTVTETLEMKMEENTEIPPTLAGNATVDAIVADVPSDKAAPMANATSDDIASLALKPTSNDPFLGDKSNSQSLSCDGESKGPTPPLTKSNLYTPLRERIAYSDESKLFIELDDLVLDHGLAGMSIEDKDINIPEPPLADLTAIFPDLQPFELLDVATALPNDVRKKSERRNDRDDPNKRSEDTTYTKLTPISPFMHCKPTLIGSLQPAKSWRSNRWIHLEDTPVTVDFEGPIIRPGDDITCDLYPGTVSTALSFPNRGDRDIRTQESKDKEVKKRAAEFPWTFEDDVCLKNLAEKYPRNWGLIAEAFNAMRISITTDRRTPRDCEDRWFARWGPDSRNATKWDNGSPAEGTPPPPTPVTPVGQMTTRGVKRSLANAIPSAVNASAAEIRKRRRRNYMQEAIRKAVKKRESAQRTLSVASQKKPSTMHDTHLQYLKMNKISPAELSRQKAEREQKEQQELMFVRRHHMAREQAQRITGTGNLQSQLLSHPQASGMARPLGTNLPPGQTVPQIRSQVNISQQQRIPTPLAAGAQLASGTPANPRLPQQQPMLQVQVRAMAQAQVQAQAQAAQIQAHAQAQALVQAHAQAQSLMQNQQGQSQPAQNLVQNLTGVTNPHLSPSYISRGSTSSPAGQQVSPPRNSATPSNANHPPRPASAQQQAASMISAAQSAGNNIPRPPTSVGHYFPNGQITDQMMQALRVQSLMQHTQQNH